LTVFGSGTLFTQIRCPLVGPLRYASPPAWERASKPRTRPQNVARVCGSFASMHMSLKVAMAMGLTLGGGISASVASLEGKCP